MKGKKGKTPDFKVPLVPEAQAIIDEARKHARDGYLFPGAKKGVISDATMSRLMERREMPYRPHGFRSSLRDWIEDCTETSFVVAENTLGHLVGGKVERAYRRTVLLDKRRKLLKNGRLTLPAAIRKGLGWSTRRLEFEVTEAGWHHWLLQYLIDARRIFDGVQN